MEMSPKKSQNLVYNINILKYMIKLKSRNTTNIFVHKSLYSRQSDDTFHFMSNNPNTRRPYDLKLLLCRTSHAQQYVTTRAAANYSVGWSAARQLATLQSIVKLWRFNTVRSHHCPPLQNSGEHTVLPTVPSVPVSKDERRWKSSSRHSNGYQQDLRPRAPNGDPLKVGVSMKINGISEVNLEQMSILFEVYLRVSWRDTRLVFPHSILKASSDAPKGLSNTQEKTSMTVSPALLKKCLSTVAGVGAEAFALLLDTFTFLQKFQGVTISSDSTVYTSVMMQLKLVCSMSFYMYPFDVQRCTVFIKSYIYQLHELALDWMPPGLSTDEDLKRQLASYDFSVRSLNGTTCSCTKCVPETSPCLRVHLVLRRHSFIHVMSSYVPSGLFVVVGWTSFFWPAEVVPGRTVLVITSLLTITSMYTGIRQTSPTTSYVKALDVWMLMCILLTTVPLLQYALILSWRKTSDSSVKKVVPGKSAAPSGMSATEIYETRKRKAEMVGRVGLPVCFLLFNLAYWPSYLTPSLYALD
ncbi:glutamate-gated chloride channel alpha-like [Portunus trituberculatus]|uniref:glutamate-gated chloride channel alpha-like n=1 Tax=Portunus trituberculatus TaxID=210409 RepID=UPI001E1D026A|nr:glutamate-gated chloride channel alpha-like [Portunus trituberculatus]